jgi:hypothetical protein
MMKISLISSAISLELSLTACQKEQSTSNSPKQLITRSKTEDKQVASQGGNALNE